ncbi:MAG TPA: GNAT family N-acetyltransferase [Oleiagrimonas sp.]|nr:GNAT family N-acetyltransferase [Oleiagrimonas sp.]
MNTGTGTRNRDGFSGPMESSPLPPRSARRFAKVTQADNPLATAEQVTIADGSQLWLRPIAPTDIDAIRRCFTRLSHDEIRMRFMHHMRELPLSMARQLCCLDPATAAANVLIDDTVTPAEMRGVGRIFVDHTCNHAEFAVLVEKAWTGYGLGALLMQRLVDECRRRELSRVWGYVLIENRPMLDLCRRLGFKRQVMSDDPGTAMIALDFD